MNTVLFLRTWVSPVVRFGAFCFLTIFLILAPIGCNPPTIYHPDPEVRTEAKYGYEFERVYTNQYIQGLGYNWPVDCTVVRKQYKTLYIETKTNVGDIFESTYHIVSSDKIQLDSTQIERVFVENVEYDNIFEDRWIEFDFLGDECLVVDRERIFFNSDNTTIPQLKDFISQGKILGISPYLYTMTEKDNLKTVAEKYNITESIILQWNPHLKWGYSTGTLLKLYLYSTR